MKALGLASLLLLALMLGGLSACTRTFSSEELSEFTALKFSNVGIGRSDYGGRGPSVFVAATSDSSLPNWVTDHLRVSGSGGVDLNKDIVIAAFRGVTGTERDLIIVTDIWQNGRTIYIRAQVVTWPTEPVGTDGSRPKVSLYDVVVVSKAQIAGHGRFAFKLLDDYGKTVAATSATIAADGEPE